ncbi:MAG TPA: glycosyltransferase family 9 protein [bacterium]|nr:glycosyltransferase family 9 protein [bacterium]
MTHTNPQKILVIRLKGIGDVILSTPLLRALKKAYPKAQVHFLTRAASAPLLQHDPLVEKVWVHPEKKAPLGDLLQFLSDLRAEKFDWTLDLAAEPRSAWLTLLSGAPLRAGFDIRLRRWAFNHRIPPRRYERRYQVEVLLDLLRGLGIEGDGIDTRIALGPGDLEWARGQWAGGELGAQRKKIGLNPTGTWPSKRWPADHWRRLALKIYERWNVKPVLVGGPGDGALLDEVAWGIGDQVLRVPSTGLLQAAAFLSQMDLLIGNDGTPQHLAQAFGVPSLTLCGPHWGLSWVKPQDPRHLYLQHFLDCGPCDLNVCPHPRHAQAGGHYQQECMVRIGPDKVFAAAQGLLGLPS